jgi:hypothetical protein
MIFDLFSKRQRALRGGLPDVYSYDKLPNPLKVQVIHIWRDALGDEANYSDNRVSTKETYRFLVDTLCREYGLFQLPTREEAFDHYGNRAYLAELCNFLLQTPDTERALDVVELSFRLIDKMTRGWHYLHRQDASEHADNAIEELNERFREHGIGYEYASGEIIRVDSKLLHAEVVKPTLTLLAASEYAGAQAEFLTAHEHYRHGRTKEALNEGLKALESIMKAICAKRGWSHDPNATAKTLIQVLFDNGLVPSFWSSHFTGLRATLEAGVPTIRNRLGGHGQGTQVVQVPPHFVAYLLHLTGSAIVFLAEAEKALP